MKFARIWILIGVVSLTVLVWVLAARRMDCCGSFASPH